MKRSERKIANVWLQVLSFCLLLLYLYLTFDSHPVNIVCFAAAVFVAVIGYFRSLLTALFASLLLLIVYGGVILYAMYVYDSPMILTWHEIAWLLIFPYMAIAGGINREEVLPKLRGMNQVDLDELEDDVPLPNTKLDAELQFHALTPEAFLESLQDCIMTSKQNRSGFTLLLIKIHRFLYFEHKFGEEQAHYLLNRTAAIINEVIPSALLKVYLEQGLFAVAMPNHQQMNATIARLRLDNRFKTMLLNRLHKRAVITVQFMYGVSEFPLHGMLAADLYHTAKQSLDAAIKEVTL